MKLFKRATVVFITAMMLQYIALYYTFSLLRAFTNQPKLEDWLMMSIPACFFALLIGAISTLFPISDDHHRDA